MSKEIQALFIQNTANIIDIYPTYVLSLVFKLFTSWRLYYPHMKSRDCFSQTFGNDRDYAEWSAECEQQADLKGKTRQLLILVDS
jgi:hypothetical protein